MSERAARPPWGLVAGIALAALVPVTEAAAEAPAAAPAAVASGGEASPSVVRVALTKAASEKLSEQRVRRLVELQVGGGAVVPAEAIGPLDENAVRVFIDLPEPTVVTVQVQAPDRRLETRNVDVAGLPWEVATRFVATAASQSVSALLAPKRKPRPRPPTPEEIARELAKQPALEVSGGLEAVYSSDLETALFGSRLRVAFHERVLSESVSLAALGSLDGGLWAEIDVAAWHRLWLNPDLRLGLGAGFALGLTRGLRAEADPDLELWVRPHGLVALDVRLQPNAWLRIGLDPGASVDASRDAVGLWMGGSAALAYEGW